MNRASRERVARGPPCIAGIPRRALRWRHSSHPRARWCRAPVKSPPKGRTTWLTALPHERSSRSGRPVVRNALSFMAEHSGHPLRGRIHRSVGHPQASSRSSRRSSRRRRPARTRPTSGAGFSFSPPPESFRLRPAGRAETSPRPLVRDPFRQRSTSRVSTSRSTSRPSRPRKRTAACAAQEIEHPRLHTRLSQPRNVPFGIVAERLHPIRQLNPDALADFVNRIIVKAENRGTGLAEGVVAAAETDPGRMVLPVRDLA